MFNQGYVEEVCYIEIVKIDVNIIIILKYKEELKIKKK